MSVIYNFNDKIYNKFLDFIMKKELRVFVVSPNDVEEERKIVKEVCKEIDSLSNDINIDAIVWEETPFDFMKNPQENINNEFYNSDIYIVILWHRLGTNVPGAVGALTKEQNVTGTQYEIEYLIANKKENVLFYIKDKEDITIKINELSTVAKQKEDLEKFFKKINFKRDNANYSYYTFKKPEEFKEKLKNHLIKKITKLTNVKLEKIIKAKNRLDKDIPPNYWAFLYVTIAITSIIAFFYVIQYSTFSNNIKYFIVTYIFSVLFLLIPLVKGLPTDYKNVGIFDFKEILFILFKRLIMTLFFALLIAIVLYLALSVLLKSFIKTFLTLYIQHNLAIFV